MTKISSSPPRRQNNSVLDTLDKAYKVFRDCQPLAIGIHKVIKERLPDMAMQQLRVALRMHTASTRYLKVVSQASTRFDLDGSAAGDVTAEQRQQALDMLRDRFKKQADRRKAEELAKQQQEKLRLLAEKFNTR